MSCGYEDVMSQLQYPPKGPIVYDQNKFMASCTTFDNLYDAAVDQNKCFNVCKRRDS